ncbi:single-pass membrane and coiled-coil domain-containing protein 1-like isoform X1 [Stegostoma tigrinum]|uniref:single-pass membrane and coiled-coil domain-containing protein 1-like isoform X1 n=1 Tax=Stegostoma tigrinum TaxID=3053191 RepID=UPI00202B296E|nr:single-pass membrane and coiled-coil domain-containing protein 1-like isoform X1 [Stegostoma tigrinum]XP_059506836.1 single-pass membrane and coiled-coil domain-containing protein 1-like isoform X1 [Stegostoma tigrinum]
MNRRPGKSERRRVNAEEQTGKAERRELKASSQKVSTELLRHRIVRLEKRIEELKAEYQKLDQDAKELIQSFEPDCESIAKEADEDELWSSLLEDRLTHVEVNIFFSYVVDILQSLHLRVLEKQPGLASFLPTLSSILRRKIWDMDLEATWTSVLPEFGLNESDTKALCAFFVTHCKDAEYYPLMERRRHNLNIKEVLDRAVPSRILHHCLFHLVQLAEKESSMMTTEQHQVNNASTRRRPRPK